MDKNITLSVRLERFLQPPHYRRRLKFRSRITNFLCCRNSLTGLHRMQLELLRFSATCGLFLEKSVDLHESPEGYREANSVNIHTFVLWR